MGGAAGIAALWIVSLATSGGAPPSGFVTPDKPPSAHYLIDATITAEADRANLEAVETILLKNTWSKPLHRLAIVWTAGWPETLDLTVNGESVELTASDDADAEGAAMFTLPTPLAPGASVEMQTELSNGWDRSDDGRISMMGDYPKLWWGVPVHDSYSVKIDAPPDFVIATSGWLNPETGRYENDHASKFSVFMGENYGLIEKVSGDSQIRVVYPPGGQPWAEIIAETAADALGFYQERFGLSPYRCYSFIPGGSKPIGGGPAGTALLVIHGMVQMGEAGEDFCRWITAHELSHDFWGSHVLDADFPAWTWIGLGLYADRAYTEARGREITDSRDIQQRYIESIAKGYDTTLAISKEQYAKITWDYNNVAIHGKGLTIISALGVVLGEDVVEQITVRCFKEFGGSRMGAAEFQRVCEEETGQDLAWFFDQWVRSNRKLLYTILEHTSKQQEDGKYVTEVKVSRQGDLRMPVPVTVTFEDGSEQTQLTDRLLKLNILRFESDTPVTTAVIDKRQRLAMAPEGKTHEQSLLPASAIGLETQFEQRVSGMPLTGSGDEPFDLFFVAIDLDIKDHTLWAKLAQTLFDGEFYREAMQAFEKVAELAPKDSPWAMAASVWQGHLFDLDGEREQAIERYRKALEQEQGRKLAFDQYGIFIDRAWIEQRIETPFVRPGQSSVEADIPGETAP